MHGHKHDPMTNKGMSHKGPIGQKNQLHQCTYSCMYAHKNKTKGTNFIMLMSRQQFHDFHIPFVIIVKTS